MDTPIFDGPDSATADPADRGNHERSTGRLLPGLWITVAAGFLIASFLKQYRVVIPELEQDYIVDGWGRLDGLGGGHGPRIGLLYAAIAALLVLAAVATIRSRVATWPIHRRGRTERPDLALGQRRILLGHFQADLDLLEDVTGVSFSDWRSESGQGAFATRVAER